LQRPKQPSSSGTPRRHLRGGGHHTPQHHRQYRATQPFKDYWPPERVQAAVDNGAVMKGASID